MSTVVASAAPRTCVDTSGSERSSSRARAYQLTLVLLASALIVIPCWWQPHVQAVDLPSHLYNAWLANVVTDHAVPGLMVARQWTNVLFDWVLRSLLRVASPEVTEKIAVSIAVWTFFWGAFQFVSAVSGRRPWLMTPCLAMLAYGWVFHMGFFNFYLSMGLCLWALAMVWHPTWKGWFIAFPLLVAASLAHDLAVAWAVSMIAYVYLSRSCTRTTRRLLPVAAVLALALLIVVLERSYITVWSAQELRGMIGIDQVWLFGRKYFLVSMGLLLVWVALFQRRLDLGSETGLGIPLDLIAINSAAVCLIPTYVQVPFYGLPLNFISPRLSLTTALLICALVATAATVREGIAFTALATLFFSFVFVDARALNQIEGQIELALESVPAGSRVVNGMKGPTERITLLTHNLDRASMGRVWSYGNYEAASGQFSLRATGPNPMVLSDPMAIDSIQQNSYVIQPRDLPLFEVTFCGTQHTVCAYPLPAGAKTRIMEAEVLPRLWSGNGVRIIDQPDAPRSLGTARSH